MARYRTFKRSCTNWEEFGRARKTIDLTNLTLEEARKRCRNWNNSRTPAQERSGTKMEFEKE